MAVLLETSKGDFVIDLFTDECPQASTNFLKLCKIKYYNNCLVHNIVPGFIAQTGDPTGTGRGGDSVYRLVYGDQARFFEDEIRKGLRHRKPGLVGMAGAGKDMNASQFYLTLGTDLDSLDEKHTLFGEVSEGMDVVTAIGNAFVDDAGRPLQNIRIRHTHVLDDPFPDPPGLDPHIPETSPEPEFEQGGRLEEDWVPQEDTAGEGERAEETRKLEAHSRAVVLEMIGDLPEAEAKPPSDMLFVCKLNPVTTEEDLEIIFSRFGKVTSCDIIRDSKTGDSLCYAFIGFGSDRAAEDAFFKMNNVLIDDRRIKVDFSQSVHHLWKQFRRFGRSGGNAGDLQPGGEPKPAPLQLKAGLGTYGGSAHRGLILDDALPSTSGRVWEGHQRRPRDSQWREGYREDRGGAQQGDRGLENGRGLPGSDRRQHEARDRERHRDQERYGHRESNGDRERIRDSIGPGRDRQHGDDRRRESSRHKDRPRHKHKHRRDGDDDHARHEHARDHKHKRH